MQLYLEADKNNLTNDQLEETDKFPEDSRNK